MELCDASVEVWLLGVLSVELCERERAGWGVKCFF